jgi:hypothetical protein
MEKHPARTVRRRAASEAESLPDDVSHDTHHHVAPRKGAFVRLLDFLFKVALLVLVAWLGWGYYEKSKEVDYLRDPKTQDEVIRRETDLIVEQVRSIFLLPNNEIPEIFTITDPESLSRQQPFFAGAISGDKVLLYRTNGKAIIYSPSRRIIVNVGPVYAEGTAAASLSEAQVPSDQTVETEVEP